ncbi:uncharacterized protein FA14DRAFT_154600 [Meira miltonrushii]|uniref:Uncharacterized protein n=1 Tax=Meira miltonrushii TaxID=1280837 RepID=A0A316VI37_9BASI|nr:uncharacterized protein FA14DRAFT_154600 [Meira miltonrushii]PWN35175.1 hypothetical protein FA14DRAFT_154600 [Meira miltonrushii]
MSCFLYIAHKMKYVLCLIAYFSAICTFAEAAFNPSPSPAFLSSEKHEKGVYDHAMDRLNIERERGRHGAHLHVQRLTAGGSHLVKVAQTGVKHVCTSINCKATKEEKQKAAQNWQKTKAEGFSAARANQKQASKVIFDSFTNQENIQRDIHTIREAQSHGQRVPQEYHDRYNENNNKGAAHALAEEKSANWARGQHRSRAARQIK